MARAGIQPKRWRIEVVEEREEIAALVRWHPSAPPPELPPAPREQGPMVALLAALARLACRGEGVGAWAPPLVDDPIAFLLDSVHDAVNVWSATGQLLYSNHAASMLELGWPGGPKLEELTRGGRICERRCMQFTLWKESYLIEVITPKDASS